MSNKNFWNEKVRDGAVLSPIDRISEVLFGLIMVLTFTGAISVTGDGREDIRELLWAALGCNVAWGIVDAVMYWMNVLMERGHGMEVIRKVRRASNEDARKTLKEELPPVLGSLLKDDEMTNLTDRIRELPEPASRQALTSRDVLSGIQIFMLVFLCTLPVALPFALFSEIPIAMRVSNGVALLLLFAGGYRLAGYAGFRPFPTAIAYATSGLLLVAITMALGG